MIIAAPIAFLIGVAAGLGLSSSFQIVRKREYDKLTAEHATRDQLLRDHSHDRGNEPYERHPPDPPDPSTFHG